eukprot:PhF_6_TR1583/c0_g1_i1/m.2875
MSSLVQSSSSRMGFMTSLLAGSGSSGGVNSRSLLSSSSFLMTTAGTAAAAATVIAFGIRYAHHQLLKRRAPWRAMVPTRAILRPEGSDAQTLQTRSVSVAGSSSLDSSSSGGGSRPTIPSPPFTFRRVQFILPVASTTAADSSPNTSEK